MKCKAYSKINLCLNVESKRSNGYHNLNMIMLPLDFCDFIDIKLSKEFKFESNVILPESNTITKAIDYLRLKYGFKENFSISLDKRIPSMAGLGGGSSDAACIIKAIDNLLSLNMSRKDMFEIAVKVGADVPFFIVNRPAYVSGIGEVVEEIDVNLDFHILLVKPEKGVSTSEVYSLIDVDKCKHVDCDKVINALENNDYGSMVESIENSLENVSIKLLNDILIIKNTLKEIGFDNALMSGSGSCVFAITQNISILEKGFRIMNEKGFFSKKALVLK